MDSSQDNVEKDSAAKKDKVLKTCIVRRQKHDPQYALCPRPPDFKGGERRRSAPKERQSKRRRGKSAKNEITDEVADKW